jgi:hypothetical protein
MVSELVENNPSNHDVSEDLYPSEYPREAIDDPIGNQFYACLSMT